MKPRRGGPHGQATSSILEVNLKERMPRVEEALAAMERALTRARAEQISAIKFIHGYGSSGQGGEIRIAVQKRLRELESAGAIRACIFGEDWSTSDARAWALLKAHPVWKRDPHLGRKNLGITIVVI